MASSSSDSSIAPTGSDAENTDVSVSLSDIKTMLSVINVVSRRGGFVPSEFGVVGGLFEKFSKLVPPSADNNK